jgi:hypothetical protein
MELCAPALIYIIFSLTQVIIDSFKGLYNTAFFKMIVMIMVTILLNILCKSGLGVVSWIIVFVPFIFMTVIVAMLLYIFGLDAATGSLRTVSDTKTTSQPESTNSTSSTNVVVVNPPIKNTYHGYHGYITTPAKTNYQISTATPNTYVPETSNEVNNYNAYSSGSDPSYESFV